MSTILRIGSSKDIK